jgi:hypothetical protein
MDQQTYEQKIRDLKASSDPDAPARIARLEAFYKTQQADEKKADTNKREVAEASFKQSLKTAYMGANSNASEADFERDYPALRTAHMQKKAQQADAEARAASRSMYRDV